MSKCAGVVLRGYRRGEPCGTKALYERTGRLWCGAHLVVAQREPARFREALEAFVRGEVRRDAQRWAKAAQTDAFPVENGNG